LQLASKQLGEPSTDSYPRILPRNHTAPAVWGSLIGLLAAPHPRADVYVLLGDLAAVQSSPERHTTPEDVVLLYLLAQKADPEHYALQDFLDSRRLGDTLRRFGAF